MAVSQLNLFQGPTKGLQGWSVLRRAWLHLWTPALTSEGRSWLPENLQKLWEDLIEMGLGKMTEGQWISWRMRGEGNTGDLVAVWCPPFQLSSFLTTVKDQYHYPHFTDEETEAQRSQWTCPGPHSCQCQSFASRTVCGQSISSFSCPGEKGRQGSRAHSYPGAIYGTPRWHPNIWGGVRVVTPRTQGMVFKQSQSHAKILNPLPSRKAQNPNDFSEENSHNNDEKINTNENWKPKGNNVEMMVEKMDLVPIHSLWAFKGPLEQSKQFVVSIRSKSRVWNANSGWWGGEGGHFSCPERPGKLNSSVSRNPVNSSVPGNLAGGSECIKKWLLFKPQAWSCGILRSTFESRWGPGEDGISSRFVWNEVAVCPSNDIRCPDMTAINGEGYLCKQKAYK